MREAPLDPVDGGPRSEARLFEKRPRFVTLFSRNEVLI